MFWVFWKILYRVVSIYWLWARQKTKKSRFAKRLFCMGLHRMGALQLLPFHYWLFTDFLLKKPIRPPCSAIIFQSLHLALVPRGLYWVIRKNVENKGFSAQSASVFCHENMHILPLSHKAPSPGISSREWLCSLPLLSPVLKVSIVSLPRDWFRSFSVVGSLPPRKIWASQLPMMVSALSL